MTKVVVGLYDRFEDAQRVVQELVNAGFERDSISLVANDAKGKFRKDTGQVERGGDVKEGAAAGAGVGAAVGGIGGLLAGLGLLAIPGIGPVLAAGPLVAALGGAGIGAAAGGLIGALVDAGIPEERAHEYAEGVRRGGTLVSVHARDDQAQKAADIMERYNPADLNQRAGKWREDKWQRFDHEAKPYTGEELDKMNIPIIEEQMRVGKRQVDQGGVRVNTYMSERQVEEDIRLREEKVDVQRRPADRPARPEDMENFKEGSFEMHEMREEPVVDKDARVVEDVTIDKDVRERDETVRGTVRKTEVDIEGTEGRRQTGRMDFDSLEPRFRKHYDTHFADRGLGYTEYRTAYRYGFDMGTNERYRDRDWNQIDRDIRQDWERTHRQSKWEDFKDAIREGWMTATRGDRR
jgi:stress response protein YsnF